MRSMWQRFHTKGLSRQTLGLAYWCPSPFMSLLSKNVRGVVNDEAARAHPYRRETISVREVWKIILESCESRQAQSSSFTNQAVSMSAVRQKIRIALSFAATYDRSYGSKTLLLRPVRQAIHTTWISHNAQSQGTCRKDLISFLGFFILFESLNTEVV